MSWQQPRGGGAGFNPNAGAFNPNAGSFVPGQGGPAPAGGAPARAPARTAPRGGPEGREGVRSADRLHAPPTGVSLGAAEWRPRRHRCREREELLSGHRLEGQSMGRGGKKKGLHFRSHGPLWDAHLDA
eukprot:303441_1